MYVDDCVSMCVQAMSYMCVGVCNALNCVRVYETEKDIIVMRVVI